MLRRLNPEPGVGPLVDLRHPGSKIPGDGLISSSQPRLHGGRVLLSCKASWDQSSRGRVDFIVAAEMG